MSNNRFSLKISVFHGNRYLVNEGLKGKAVAELPSSI